MLKIKPATSKEISVLVLKYRFMYGDDDDDNDDDDYHQMITRRITAERSL